VYSLEDGTLKLVTEWQKEFGIKCGTFRASPVSIRDCATVDYKGKLIIYDIERGAPKYEVQAHSNMGNQVDGIGGKGAEYGAPELVTGGSDGCVRVWDPRQQAPVVSLEPSESETIKPDCWAVAFGNAFNQEERCLVAGYDNGDVKLFDLRTNCLRWDTNVANGVCGIEFDRPDINMNKLVVATLESKFHVFDMKTYHPQQGYTGLSEMAHKSTIWGVRHIPQNRDLFTTLGGNGALNLWKYHYPPNRSVKDQNELPIGVVGKVELLNEKVLAQQPIVSVDWNVDKLGLACSCSLD
jgi:WD repeat-containing protein 92